MNFLPITINGKKVYVGFWKRLCAGILDILILMPISCFFAWFEGFDTILAIFNVILSNLLFAMYCIYCHACFGATLGKQVVGVKITKTDGSAIGWIEAWKRSSVDLVFAALMIYCNIWALLHVNHEEYASLDWIKRTGLLMQYFPSWFNIVNILGQAWVWSELIVLLFNARKRAIHDFIAGTVVIHKEFAKTKSGGSSTKEPSLQADCQN